MIKRSFQGGSLYQVPTKRGFKWVLRFSQDGKRKAQAIGTDKDLPTEREARIKAATYTAVINKDVKAFTVAELVAKYRISDKGVRVQTGASYESNLKHIEARWSAESIDGMLKDLLAVEQWLSGLRGAVTGKPLSKKTKQNVKALLHRLVNSAMLWGYMPVAANPISLVRIRVSGVQPKKRKKFPMSIKQYHALMNDKELSQHVKAMAALAMLLGLRISEILALRWEHIDYKAGTILVESSIVGKHIDATKTDASEAEMPMHKELAAILRAWQKASTSENGWVFESAITGRPFHRDSLQADHLAPAGVRLGIPNLGWHTFRHTYITLLRECEVTENVQMMLMRHADMRTTNSYGRDGGSLSLRRSANTTVVASIVRKRGSK